MRKHEDRTVLKHNVSVQAPPESSNAYRARHCCCLISHQFSSDTLSKHFKFVFFTISVSAHARAGVPLRRTLKRAISDARAVLNGPDLGEWSGRLAGWAESTSEATLF
jgi:hypothetical protein